MPPLQRGAADNRTLAAEMPMRTQNNIPKTLDMNKDLVCMYLMIGKKDKIAQKDHIESKIE